MNIQKRKTGSPNPWLFLGLKDCEMLQVIAAKLDLFDAVQTDGTLPNGNSLELKERAWLEELLNKTYYVAFGEDVG